MPIINPGQKLDPHFDFFFNNQFFTYRKNIIRELCVKGMVETLLNRNPDQIKTEKEKQTLEDYINVLWNYQKYKKSVQMDAVTFYPLICLLNDTELKNPDSVEIDKKISDYLNRSSEIQKELFESSAELSLDISYKKAIHEAPYKLKVNLSLIAKENKAQEVKEEDLVEDLVEESEGSSFYFFKPYEKPKYIVDHNALRAAREIREFIKERVSDGTIQTIKTIYGLNEEDDSDALPYKLSERFYTESQFIIYLPENMDIEKINELIEGINQIAKKHSCYHTKVPDSDAKISGVVSLRMDYDEHGKYFPSTDYTEEHLKKQDDIVSELFAKNENSNSKQP